MPQPHFLKLVSMISQAKRKEKGQSSQWPAAAAVIRHHVWWCMVVYSGVRWCTGVWWCMVVYSGVRWCMVVYGGVWWCTVV